MPHVIESKKSSKASAADKDKDRGDSPKKEKFDEKRANNALVPFVMKFTNFKVVNKVEEKEKSKKPKAGGKRENSPKKSSPDKVNAQTIAPFEVKLPYSAAFFQFHPDRVTL
jgi:hypothetical protein